MLIHDVFFFGENAGSAAFFFSIRGLSSVIAARRYGDLRCVLLG
jgi:hypothetical protein